MKTVFNSDVVRPMVFAAALTLLSGCSQKAEEEATLPGEPAANQETADKIVKIVQYEFDAAKGRVLFVSRGCVLCHSVNGVGGRAAFPLDKETFLAEIDPVHFSARMWRGAPEMIRLQQMELGYQINLGAQDIAHLAAFAGDPEEQRKLTLDQVPEDVQNSFLNEFMWIDAENMAGEAGEE